ncbi:hypothetical protein [uncultured Mucilaginibacter sp.]|uniref:hypothetical protein n=1 Tax=uncultured Mucilaginibacter sp. TaxID=797541 RepID=UPI00260813C6|nr:hypothetical protein [uncultured Mucilaginibacter sp.]
MSSKYGLNPLNIAIFTFDFGGASYTTKHKLQTPYLININKKSRLKKAPGLRGFWLNKLAQRTYRLTA